MNAYDSKYQQKSKSILSAEPNYFVHFAMRYPVTDKTTKLLKYYEAVAAACSLK